MKTKVCIPSVFFAVALVASFGGCDKSSKSSQHITGVRGSVADTANSPILGVNVAAGGIIATTDSMGKFEIEVPEGDNLTLRFSRVGFIPTQKQVDIRDGVAAAIEVKMKSEAAAKPLDAATGGTISADRGAQLIAGAGAFVDANGGAVTGMVDVHLTPFDPSDEAELRAIPTLRAELEGGLLAELASFGVLDVTVRQNGGVLDVKEGEILTIHIPAPAGGAATPPATIALWSFDDQVARWKEEGIATYLQAEGVYEAEITHMSAWNADQVMETTCIRGTVVDGSGAPVPGAYVFGQGSDYNGMSDATADANGQFCMAVRKNSITSVTVYLAEGGGVTREVSSTGTTASIPPNCASCTDGGEWVVSSGQYSGADGQTVDCESISTNPFGGTCADAFWKEFAMCFQPGGDCTVSLTGSTSWENGARIAMEGLGTMVYYGPSGQRCGTTTVSMDTANSGIIYTLPNGTVFTIKIDVENPDEMVMVCSDGTEIVFDSRQQEAMVACTGGDAEQSECQIEGMASCADDPSQCAAGTVCCPLEGTGMSMCMPEILCSAASG